MGFSKERLEAVMDQQGINDYDELRDLMGYKEGIDIKRFFNDSIPLNVLNNLCSTLNVNRDYLMMYSDEADIKPLNVQSEEPMIKRGGGRQCLYVSDPENYEKCEIDYTRLLDSIDNSDWSVASLSEFIDDNIYKILNGDANSILRKTMYNLSWALNQDRFYLIGKSSIVSRKHISSYQNKCKNQNYVINSNFIRTFNDETIYNIADIIKIPAYILQSAKDNNVFVTEKIADKLRNALTAFNITERYGGIAIQLYNIPSTVTKEEEEKPITLKDIIDMVNNLSTDDIEKLGQYCNGTAMYRNVLETIQ